MRNRVLAVAIALAGCTSQPTDVGVDPGEAGGGGGGDGSGSGSDAGSGKSDGGGSGSAALQIPDVHCTGAPNAGPAGSFRHFTSRLITALGSPKHRGIDLMAPASATTQSIEGDISYTVADKALEDENVDLFACRVGAWTKLGTARTNGEGHFAFNLTGTARLQIAMRDLYVSVVADRTGAAFLGLVAPEGTKLVASDVDGTLTDSENSFTTAQLTSATVGIQPGAPAAFVAATAKPYIMVYVTARGRQYTGATRSWLATNGFPRGPLRLASSFITLPGSASVDYKTGVLNALTASSFEVSAGVGNRATDVTAYTNAGVTADRIFIKLPEFTSEVQADLMAHRAIGFMTYDDLRTMYISAM